jgi:ubiquitin thioesterase ZRANB1
LDSVLQATWGIFDRDNVLRKALADSLIEASSLLFARFKEAETLQANLLHFTLDDDQWQEDWAVILCENIFHIF